MRNLKETLSMLRERVLKTVRGKEFANALVFLPGLIFFFISISILVAPDLVLLLMSGLAFSFGCLATFFASRYVQVRRKLDGIIKQFDGEMVVHSVRLSEDQPDGLHSIDGKKQIFH